MAIHKRSLFLISLFLASASLSLAVHRSTDLVRDLDQCLEKCQEPGVSQHDIMNCEGLCGHDYYAQRQYQQCQQRCETIEGPQKGHCLDRCENQLLEEEEKEMDEIREMIMDSTRRQQPREPYRHCQQLCQSMHQEARPQCLRICDKQFRRHGDDDNSFQDPEEECEQLCREVTTGLGEQKRCQSRCVRCQERCPERGQQESSCSRQCRREIRSDFGDEEINTADTTRKCLQQCQGEPSRQQGQCLRKCESEMEQYYPEEQCQRRCQRQGRGFQQCQTMCERCERRCQEHQSQPGRMRQCRERCERTQILDFIGIDV